MIRTQIYIPENMHSRVKLLANKEKKTLAGVLRDFIQQGLDGKTQSKRNSLERLIKLKITGGPKDLSQNMDKYLFQEWSTRGAR